MTISDDYYAYLPSLPLESWISHLGFKGENLKYYMYIYIFFINEGNHRQTKPVSIYSGPALASIMQMKKNENHSKNYMKVEIIFP